MSKNVYHIGSGALTFEIIERIINENLKLELAPEAKLRIQKCRDYLDQKIASSEEPLYGITTGFGSLCTKNISPDELGTLQENLIKSHACSVGEEIRPVIIKLMMLLKAHALSLGHSGVQVITVQRILDFFNNDVMPIVYDRAPPQSLPPQALLPDPGEIPKMTGSKEKRLSAHRQQEAILKGFLFS